MLNLIVTAFLLANIFRSLEHSVGTWSICHKVCISLLRHSPNVNWSTHSNVSANSPPEDSMCTCIHLQLFKQVTIYCIPHITRECNRNIKHYAKTILGASSTLEL